MKKAAACLLSLALCACAVPHSATLRARFEPIEADTTAHLRGLHVLGNGVVWASGSAGTVLRSVDRGSSFSVHAVPGAETNELRDIHGFDAERACVIACQPARIYRTTDGAKSFEMVFEADGSDAFLDGIAFFDERRGVAFGDPVGGCFMILRTTDGGASWRAVDAAAIAPPLPGEGGFAASGTCLTVGPDGRAWIGTGIGGARVLASSDFGRSWTAVSTPMGYGESAGVFSLAFCADGRLGVAVGGDYREQQARGKNAAFSTDGGRRWRLARTPPRGFRSCVARVPGTREAWVAVGEPGADVSTDGGVTWRPLGDHGYHAIEFAPDGTGIAVGAGGRIARCVVQSTAR